MRSSDWREQYRGRDDKAILRGLVANTDYGGMTFNVLRSKVTLDTTDAETNVGLTPTGTIFHAALRVSVAIVDLDSADHHIQLGVSGTTDKYIDKANGSAATSIALNTKDVYGFDPDKGKETAALILTITGGADNTPSAGEVELEIVYLSHDNLADG